MRKVTLTTPEFEALLTSDDSGEWTEEAYPSEYIYYGQFPYQFVDTAGFSRSFYQKGNTFYEFLSYTFHEEDMYCTINYTEGRCQGHHTTIVYSDPGDVAWYKAKLLELGQQPEWNRSERDSRTHLITRYKKYAKNAPWERDTPQFSTTPTPRPGLWGKVKNVFK